MVTTDAPRILAVEDNSETQLLLQHLLEPAYQIEVTGGIETALEVAEDEHFDVLLLDINLSEERTGTDLLHLLRDRRDLGGVPAIALTAYAMPGDRESFLDKGFDRYVSKPFTRSDLTDAIDESLEPAR
jgi:CheY-like chemotaxis protein